MKHSRRKEIAEDETKESFFFFLNETKESLGHNNNMIKIRKQAQEETLYSASVSKQNFCTCCDGRLNTN